MTRSSTALLAAAALQIAIDASPAYAAFKGGEDAVTADRAKLAKACEGRDGWTDSAPPARIFGNTYYVGTCGISAILVAGDAGHVLIDGGMEESAPLVLANIRALGFEPRNVLWIVLSHEHFDHVAALAALQKATGARIAALNSSAEILSTGKPVQHDPQFGQLDAFHPVRVDRIMTDGEKLAVGKLQLTIHATPAHSPGSTSWTWQSCDNRKRCTQIAYADSVTTISAEGYRFTDHPQRIAAVRDGLDAVAALPCDVLVTPHPSASELFDRLSGKVPLVDSNACRAYAASARTRFEARLAEEKEGSNS